jgi:hypothetical protein
MTAREVGKAIDDTWSEPKRLSCMEKDGQVLLEGVHLGIAMAASLT